MREIAAIAALLSCGVAHAGTLAFSDASSDATSAAALAATLTYSLPSTSTLELSLRNDTTGSTPFDISSLYFNTFADLLYILILGAESSLEGPNTGAWRFICTGDEIVSPGFGTFDHVLRPSASTDAHRIAPGETQRFTFVASCAGAHGCDERILADWSHGANSAVFAARFEDGPDGDAATGAILVPEPGTSALLAVGLAALSAARALRPDARVRRGPRSPRAASRAADPDHRWWPRCGAPHRSDTPRAGSRPRRRRGRARAGA